MSNEDVALELRAALERFVYRVGGRMTVEQLERASGLNLRAEQREAALEIGGREGWWEVLTVGGRRIVIRLV
jgi:hypothetical protein